MILVLKRLIKKAEKNRFLALTKLTSYDMMKVQTKLALQGGVVMSVRAEVALAATIIFLMTLALGFSAWKNDTARLEAMGGNTTTTVLQAQ